MQKLNEIEQAKANVPKEKADEWQIGISSQEAKNKLRYLVNNKPVLKSSDGEEARLSVNSIGKLMSRSAVNKSIGNGFTIKQHFAAASDIDNLFANSVKILTHADRNNDPNVVAMHRFVAPLFGNNGAFITVKESTEHGKRVYSVELIELGKLEGHMSKVKLNFPSLAATSNPANNIQNS